MRKTGHRSGQLDCCHKRIYVLCHLLQRPAINKLLHAHAERLYTARGIRRHTPCTQFANAPQIRSHVSASSGAPSVFPCLQKAPKSVYLGEVQGHAHANLCSFCCSPGQVSGFCTSGTACRVAATREQRAMVPPERERAARPGSVEAGECGGSLREMQVGAW